MASATRTCQDSEAPDLYLIGRQPSDLDCGSTIGAESYFHAAAEGLARCGSSTAALVRFSHIRHIE